MKYGSAIVAGIVATLAMTGVMFLAPFLGAPKMNVGEMLSGMTGTPLAAGWIMHFMIGCFFAVIYAGGVNNLIPIDQNMARGMVYGLLVFLFAQAAMAMMRSMGFMPAMDGDVMKAMGGSLLGHLAYGYALSYFFQSKTVVNTL